MKRYLNFAFYYFLFAMAGGVFYREFTKFLDFSGKTTLSLVHVHLMVLGTFLFLLLALFTRHLKLEEERSFRRFLILHSIALPFYGYHDAGSWCFTGFGNFPFLRCKCCDFRNCRNFSYSYANFLPAAVSCAEKMQ